MISIIILLTYYDYPANRSGKKTERNAKKLDQHLANVNVDQEPEVIPYCFKTNNANKDQYFNI